MNKPKSMGIIKKKPRPAAKTSLPSKSVSVRFKHDQFEKLRIFADEWGVGVATAVKMICKKHDYI